MGETTITVRQICFRSFVKLFAVFSASLGVMVGVIAFIGSLFKLPVNTTLFIFEFTGVIAGVISIFLAPMIFGLLGLIVGCITYIPASLIINLCGGIEISGRFD